LRQTHKSSPYVRQLGLDSRTVNPIDIHILYALQKHRYKSALSLKFSEPKRITLDFINKHNISEILHQFSFFHPYIVYIRPIKTLSRVNSFGKMPAGKTASLYLHARHSKLEVKHIYFLPMCHLYSTLFEIYIYEIRRHCKMFSLKNFRVK
jgi:hypothetical protein